jgi:outer membrane lipoprotein-sorting protein
VIEHFNYKKFYKILGCDTVKKHVLCIVMIALIAFLVGGCTNNDTAEPQQEPEDQFAEYTGKIAIITEDVSMKDPM